MFLWPQDCCDFMFRHRGWYSIFDNHDCVRLPMDNSEWSGLSRLLLITAGSRFLTGRIATAAYRWLVHNYPLVRIKPWIGVHSEIVVLFVLRALFLQLRIGLGLKNKHFVPKFPPLWVGFDIAVGGQRARLEHYSWSRQVPR